MQLVEIMATHTEATPNKMAVPQGNVLSGLVVLSRELAALAMATQSCVVLPSRPTHTALRL